MLWKKQNHKKSHITSQVLIICLYKNNHFYFNGKTFFKLFLFFLLLINFFCTKQKKSTPESVPIFFN